MLGDVGTFSARKTYKNEKAAGGPETSRGGFVETKTLLRL
jgi:hypothetical protein